jgi:3D (Asp-Asp-Asp) domain-containing protein
MENLTLIRKQRLAVTTLTLSLLWAFPNFASASFGNKPSDRHESHRTKARETKATKTDRKHDSKPGFFAALFHPEKRRESHPQLAFHGGSVREVRTTAYTHDEADHQAYGRSTAIGTTLRACRAYNSAAADWSRFPLGTKFQIVGEPTVYVVDDCGGALYGPNTIDIYRPSLSSMDAWGTRFVQIKILDFGRR